MIACFYIGLCKQDAEVQVAQPSKQYKLLYLCGESCSHVKVSRWLVQVKKPTDEDWNLRITVDLFVPWRALCKYSNTPLFRTLCPEGHFPLYVLYLISFKIPHQSSSKHVRSYFLALSLKGSQCTLAQQRSAAGGQTSVRIQCFLQVTRAQTSVSSKISLCGGTRGLGTCVGEAVLFKLQVCTVGVYCAYFVP